MIPALYVLYVMRGYTALIHRLGRALQGLSPMTHVIARAEAALAWQAAGGGVGRGAG